MSSETTQALELLASPLSRFRPWRAPDTGRSPQAEFFAAAADFRYRIFRGGNRTGKSQGGTVDVLLACLGWHKYFPKKPPINVWVVALDWDTIGQVLWPKFKQFLSLDRVKVGWQKRTGVEIPESVRFPNGSLIVFKSAESTREKFQGKDLDLAWIDEEVDGGIVQEIEARLIDRGGYLNITLTPVARKAWVADLERKTANGKPMTKVIRASMRDAAAAGILDSAAVEAFLGSLPDRQRRVRELGDFAALEGLVYPEFTEHTHVLRPRGEQLVDGDGKVLYPWPLPRSWPRFGAVDFGYAVPTAVVQLVEDPNTERWLVERCYYAPAVRASRWAQILRAELPPLAAPLVADHQAFERAEFGAAGVATMPAKKDVVPGLEAVERALLPREDGYPRIMLVQDDLDPPRHPIVGRCDAHWLSWEIQNYRYPEPRAKDKLMNVPRDLPVKKDDHLVDALRYLVMHLEQRRGADAPFVAPPVSRHEILRESAPLPPGVSPG